MPGMYLEHNDGAGIVSDRALLRAYELLGGLPRSIALPLLGEATSPSLHEDLTRRLPLVG
jgi:hypothetical protein